MISAILAAAASGIHPAHASVESSETLTVQSRTVEGAVSFPAFAHLQDRGENNDGSEGNQPDPAGPGDGYGSAGHGETGSPGPERFAGAADNSDRSESTASPADSNGTLGGEFLGQLLETPTFGLQSSVGPSATLSNDGSVTAAGSGQGFLDAIKMFAGDYKFSLGVRPDIYVNSLGDVALGVTAGGLMLSMSSGVVVYPPDRFGMIVLSGNIFNATVNFEASGLNLSQDLASSYNTYGRDWGKY